LSGNIHEEECSGSKVLFRAESFSFVVLERPNKGVLRAETSWLSQNFHDQFHFRAHNYAHLATPRTLSSLARKSFSVALTICEKVIKYNENGEHSGAEYKSTVMSHAMENSEIEIAKLST
jgi:hypothetical protein